MATPVAEVRSTEIPSEIPCSDFLEFQEALKKMRTIDDKIIYALNTSIPTDSFKSNVDAATQCERLYKDLMTSYAQRDGAIKKCIAEVSQNIHELKEKQQATSNGDSPQDLKKLRKEQTKLRLMQAEVNIEEVVKDRSLKVFYERCRFAYKPPDVNKL